MTNRIRAGIQPRGLTKNERSLLILMMLAAVLIQLRTGSERPLKKARGDTPSVIGAWMPGKGNQDHEISWPSGISRDPFQRRVAIVAPTPAVEPPPERIRPSAQELAAKRLKVRSVVIGARPLAVINGRTTGVGDEVDGFIVREIQSERVVVELDGETASVGVERV